MNEKLKSPLTARQVKFLVLLLLLFICSGATFYHFVENWDWVNSFYFTVVTLATVGYGDLTPTHDVSKIFTMFYIFFGAGFFIYVANSFIRYRATISIEAAKLRRNGSDADKKGNQQD